MNEYIEVGQPLQFTDPNTPTRVGEIVENVSDIYNIPSPRLGMQVFVKSEKKSFVITSLKSKVIGGVDVPEAAVETFEAVGGDVTAIYNAIQQNTDKIDAEISRAKEAEQTLSDTITENVENIANYIAEEVETLVKEDNDIKSSALGYDRQTPLHKADKVTIKSTTIDGTKEHSFDISAATPESAGVMSAEDKKALDAVPNKIESAITEESKVTDEKIAKEKTRAETVEQTLANDIANAPNLALRALFVAAGAEYNDTDQIIQKTAPWGTEETWVKNADGTYTYSEVPAIVDHLPKHYYLNGLGDITEEQMMDIYNVTYPALVSTHWDSLFRKANSKDIIPRTNLFLRNAYSISILKSISGSFYNTTIEVIRFVGETVENDKTYKLTPTATSHAFVNCQTKHVIGVINLVNDGNNITYAGSNMPNVRYMYLHNLKSNLPLFTTSKHIEKRCILYLIQNATPTSPITITLHPDAYARIANQPDILEALAAKPLITLASA